MDEATPCGIFFDISLSNDAFTNAVLSLNGMTSDAVLVFVIVEEIVDVELSSFHCQEHAAEERMSTQFRQ